MLINGSKHPNPETWTMKVHNWKPVDLTTVT